MTNSPTQQRDQGTKRELIAKACGRIWHPESQHAVETERSGVTAGSTNFQYRMQYCKCGAYKLAEDRFWSFDSDPGKGEFGDPFGDLNCIHEAEKVLSYDQLPRYVHILRHRVLMTVEGVSDFDLMHATAAQRAEAFGIACGLWT